MDESWEAHRREHALEKEADERARGLEREALVLARQDMNRRLDSMNELRTQINVERGLYLTRTEYEAKHEQLQIQLQSIERTLASLTGRLTILAALAGFTVSVVAAVILKLVNV